MRIELPADVRQILSELQKHGYEGYAVGGCVRDSLLGFEPKDWDITTNAAPDEMREVFRAYHIVPTGEKYGTMTVMLNNTPYEVTAYRADGAYSDGRRPDTVAFSRILEEDLRRRDFTINAMAYNDESGLVDLFGGLRDLKRRVLQCVGCPEERFNEDALRIMRAVRFSVTLDFGISKETVAAIWECGQNLSSISWERKRDELIKTLKGIHRLDKTAAHYAKTRWMVEYIIKRVLPEYQELAQFTHNNPYHYTDVFTHTMDMLFMAGTADIEVLLTVLFHDVGKMKARVFNEKRLTNHYYQHEMLSAKMTKDMMERLRFDNSTIERVVLLVSAHDYVIRPNRGCAKKLLQKLGLDLCMKLAQFQMLDKAAHRWETKDAYDEWVAGVVRIRELWQEIIENKEAFNIRDLAINGHDLMEIGFIQGKTLGDALAQCLEYVIEYPEKNTKVDLIEYILEQGLASD